ncbi:SDR family oxidoreductase [Paenibacillus daejeonensis]|uniref:SDR family oxidoreductase n=1 Tax=Paenibacillus daejeonensis TaxID=135193 RepID=UPI0003782A07|nr:SDR family oxidoreductase [Paenibacillus daejeonensis]
MPSSNGKKINPPQHQDRRPGLESEMHPQPEFDSASFHPGGKLTDKVAIITGGDSGIGRAAAVAYAKEGADVVIVYLNEHEDAKVTERHIEQAGRRCLLLAGDVGDSTFCADVVKQTIETFGKLDILVNNAAEQHPQQQLEDISDEQLEKTFRTNIFSMFYLTKAALPHLKKGAAIINTSSVTAYRGSPNLLDYSSTKGAIVAFTRSLATNIAGRGIRVNGVAPGPIWTPLIPSTFEESQVATFGADTPMQRPGQPEELAPAYVYLACDDSSYMTGQMLHINGGEIING